MPDLLERVEKELNIPREKLIEEGLKPACAGTAGRHFLEEELIDLSIEIKKLGQKHGVESFEELWNKLELGKITETECYDDLSRLEYLELEKEKIVNLLSRTGK